MRGGIGRGEEVERWPGAVDEAIGEEVGRGGGDDGGGIVVEAWVVVARK